MAFLNKTITCCTFFITCLPRRPRKPASDSKRTRQMEKVLIKTICNEAATQRNTATNHIEKQAKKIPWRSDNHAIRTKEHNAEML